MQPLLWNSLQVEPFENSQNSILKKNYLFFFGEADFSDFPPSAPKSDLQN